MSQDKFSSKLGPATIKYMTIHAIVKYNEIRSLQSNIAT